MLEIKTILLFSVLIEIVGALMVIKLWRQGRDRYEGMGFWVVDFILQAVGLSLIILRGNIPDGLSIVVANTLMIVGAVFGYRGLERFLGKRGPQIQNYILLALFPILHALFLYVWPSLEFRTINFTLSLGLVCAQCMWLMLRRADVSMRSPTQWVGRVFAAYVLVCAIRLLIILLRPFTTNDFFHSGTTEALILIAFQMLFILLAYALTLMVNRRLILGLQMQEEKYSKAFHSSPYGILITRMADAKIIEVNEGFLRMTGYRLEELVGMSTLDRDLWAKRTDRDHMVDTLDQGGKLNGLEVLVKKKSGEIITGLFSADVIIINNVKCILTSINDISGRKRDEAERERLVVERQKALWEVKALSGMLPICASCKKIRDDKGYWNQIENYIGTHTAATFSHGICPDCIGKLYPDHDANASALVPVPLRPDQE